MRFTGTRVLAAALLAGYLLQAGSAGAEPYEQRSAFLRTLYTGIAVVANVTPIVSAIFAPRCLPGYVACKITFAGSSLVAAADQLALSGGSDMGQMRAILYRGFAGDWYLTGRHIAGDLQPDPLPEPPPPAAGADRAWEPPPR